MRKIAYFFKRLFNMNIKNAFKTIGKIHKRSGKSRIIIFFDMIICAIKYQAGYTDYFLFNFETLNKKQRSTYITRGVSNNYIKLLNNREYYPYFSDKIKFNDSFKKYLNRDYIDLNNSSLDEFKKFLSNKDKIIVKPLSDSGGKGISIIKIDKTTNIEELYNELKETKRTLAEEVINQHEEMKKLSPSSVNTLRIVTITINGETHIMVRVIRMGDGHHDVDNFHSGGMFSVFDENGVVTKPAIDREGNIYEVHPLTNEKIIGFKIPYYKEAIEMVKEASKVIPEVRYIGFDVAITDKGPVLVEGNELPGYDLYQSKIHISDSKEGLKPLFDKVIYGDKNEN